MTLRPDARTPTRAGVGRYTSMMTRTIANALFVAVATGALASCVNDYLIEGGSTGSTSTGDALPSTTTEPDDSSTETDPDAATGIDGDSRTSTSTSTTSSTSEGSGDGDTPSTEPDTTDTDTGDTSDTGAELCQPCESDAQCGGPNDLCVMTGEAQTVCLRTCGEGCPGGFSCESVTSVDGVRAQQCTPNRGNCLGM